MKPLLLLVPAATLGALLVSGCQSAPTASAGSPARATTTAAGDTSGAGGGAGQPTSRAATTKQSGGASTRRGGATTGGTPSCRISQLAVSIGGQQGSAGHSAGAIRFRNAGPNACRLHGYPGVAALNSVGKQVAQAQRTPRGYMGGLGAGQHTPTTVTLAPGHTASALVEAENAAPDGSSCGATPALLVTPPDETHRVKLSWQGGCSSFQIHPVVPGDTGQGGTGPG
ncbi:DUF4232 domain-containing protein [Actinoplanes siamensis]|uniref:Lipoprotein n=1 Tax=Actinoplanes siamensis TaxID=1223317 RepID=A0A919N9Q3_9ACTN|nr:DUF4232 domain-containing protein [Actinoplanes siamensis]GIF06886.1 lipoprotein [Actinoplanes siamensis]